VVEALGVPVEERLEEQRVGRAMVLQIGFRPVHPRLRGGHQFGRATFMRVFSAATDVDLEAVRFTDADFARCKF